LVLVDTRTTLFPYTTLFRSSHGQARGIQVTTACWSLLALCELSQARYDVTESFHVSLLARLALADIAAATGDSSVPLRDASPRLDRKSTRLNSSHGSISYAV